MLVWVFSEFLGYAGGLLILYSVIAGYTKQIWPPVEQIAQLASSFLTIVGAMVTAGSIYLPPLTTLRPPWTHSRYVVSPLVILASLVAIYFLCTLRQLPPVLVGGFGLLAISGGIKRLLPYPKEQT